MSKAYEKIVCNLANHEGTTVHTDYITQENHQSGNIMIKDQYLSKSQIGVKIPADYLYLIDLYILGI